MAELIIVGLFFAACFVFGVVANRGESNRKSINVWAPGAKKYSLTKHRVAAR